MTERKKTKQTKSEERERAREKKGDREEAEPKKNYKLYTNICLLIPYGIQKQNRIKYTNSHNFQENFDPKYCFVLLKWLHDGKAKTVTVISKGKNEDEANGIDLFLYLSFDLESSKRFMPFSFQVF